MIEPLTEHEMLNQLTLGRKVNELVEALEKLNYHNHDVISESGDEHSISLPRYDV
jgi:hypothetical protein